MTLSRRAPDGFRSLERGSVPGAVASSCLPS